MKCWMLIKNPPTHWELREKSHQTYPSVVAHMVHIEKPFQTTTRWTQRENNITIGAHMKVTYPHHTMHA